MPPIKKIVITLALLTAVSSLPTPQLAGEGKAADSLLSSTDNGIGYGIENAEDNTAALISSLKGGAPTRRQLDKISNGFQTLSNAAGIGGSTTSLTNSLNTLDGGLTNGAANLGADTGSTEEGSLEAVGDAVPRM